MRGYAALLRGLVVAVPDRLVQPGFTGMPRRVLEGMSLASEWEDAVVCRSAVLAAWLKPMSVGLSPVYMLLLEWSRRCRGTHLGGFLEGPAGASGPGGSRLGGEMERACQGLLKPNAMGREAVQKAFDPPHTLLCDYYVN